MLRLLQVVHGVTAVLMAWPFYALLITRERKELGGDVDRVDTYMENIIRPQAVRCLVFQLTLLVSGPLIVYLRAGDGWLGLLTGGNRRLLGKEILVLLLIGMSLYMHVVLQPRIDRLLGIAREDPAARRELARLRGRRRWMAGVCLWYVLAAVILGLQAWQPFGLGPTVVFAAIAALFVWRAFTGPVRWGWV